MATNNSTEVNDYGKEIEPWKIKLALSRIRRFGFPKHEWNDLLQELVMEILQFRYEPQRSNGAKESTALCALINNQLSTIRRAKEREWNKLAEYAARLRASAPSYVDRTALRLDVREVLGTLTPRQRSVCAGLSQGDSIRQIARSLDCAWHTVKRAFEAIRERFQAMGFKG